MTPGRGLYPIIASMVVVVMAGCATPARYPVGASAWVQPGSESTRIDGKLAAQARSDPEALLRRGLRWQRENVHDYRCRFHRIERLGGQLKAPQEIAVDFLVEPRAVYMRWLKNPPAAERLLYVAGRNDGQMLALPVMVGWLTGPVAVDPGGADARKHSRRPITEFGFGPTLERLLGAYADGSDRRGFEDRYIGPVSVQGQTALAFERVKKDGPSGSEDVAAGWRFCLDAEHLQPVAITEFNADDQVLGEYVFSDIEYNVGLSVDDFAAARLKQK